MPSTRLIVAERRLAFVMGVRTGYPDLVVTVCDRIAEGEWVATEIRAEGTFASDWLEMAPHHRRLVFTGVNLNRVVDGKIVEQGGATNMLEPFLTSGALRPVGEEEAV